MNNSPFIVELIKRFSPAEWPRVFLALYRDKLIWNALEKTSLGQQALEKLSAEPRAWSPAAIVLLAMNEPIEIEALNSMPLQALDERMAGKASQAFEDWIEGGKSPTSLDRVGLLALGMRERFIELPADERNWRNLLAKIADIASARTVLACLFGMVYDPERLLSELIDLKINRRNADIALHVLLSNPQTLEERLNIIESLKKKLSLEGKLAIFTELTAEWPAGASLLSEGFSEESENIFEGQASGLDENPVGIQFERLADAFRMAQVYSLAGKPEKAMPQLAEALRRLQRMRGHLYAQLAKTVSQTRKREGVAWQENGKDTTLEAWRQAVHLVPDEPLYIAGLAEELASLGQTSESYDYLQKYLLEPKKLLHPSLLLLAALLAVQQGDSQATKQYAIQCLQLQESGSRMEKKEYEALAKIFTDFGDLVQVLSITQKALSFYPLDRDLLALHAQTVHQLGESEQDLTSAFAALAAEDTTYPDQRNNSDTTNYREQTNLYSALQTVPHLAIQKQVIHGLESAGEWQIALDEWEKLLPIIEKPSLEDWHSITNCAIGAGKPERAIEASYEALRIAPEDLQAHQQLGEASLAIGDANTAIRHYHLAVRLMPEQAALWKALIQSLKIAGQSAEILNMLRAASYAVPQDAEIHQYLGETYLEQGALTQALASFRKANELSSNQSGAFHQRVARHLGQTLFRLGYLTEACQVLDEAYRLAVENQEGRELQAGERVENSSPDLDLAYAYAQALMGVGKHTQAVPLLTEVVGARPDFPEHSLELARALVQIPNQPEGSKKAIPILQRLLGLDPQGVEGGYSNMLNASPWMRAEARLLLAEGYCAAGEWSKAMDAYRIALEEPANREPGVQGRLSLGMGLVALKLDQPDIAVAALKEASNSEPLNADIQRSLAEAYMASDLDQDAYQAAKAARDLSPADLDLLTWFINFCVRASEKSQLAHLPIREEMIAALQTAIQMAPNRADLLLHLGNALMESGNPERAREVFQQLSQAGDPEHPVEVVDLSRSAKNVRLLGDELLAVSLLQRAIAQLNTQVAEGNDSNPISLLELYEELSETQQQAGDIPSAIQAIEQALILESGNPALYIRKGDLFLEIGKMEAALEALEHALQLAPKNTKLRLTLAQVLKRLGHLPAALSHIEKALSQSNQVLDKGLRRSLYTFGAELAYATLKPRKAYEYLKAGIAEGDPVYNEIKNLGMRADLAIEVGEEEVARQLLLLMENQAPDHLRSLAISARLDCRSGNCEERSRKCRRAVQEMIRRLAQGEAEKLKTRSEFVADMLSVSQAALANRQWSEALRLLRQLVEIVPEEAICHQKLAEALVMRAETQALSSELEVVRHAPGDSALSGQAMMEFENCLVEASRRSGEPVIDPTRTGDIDRGSAESRLILTAWTARGRAVFQPELKLAKAFQSILEKTNSRAIDIAALVMSYRRCGSRGEAVSAIQVGWRPGFEGEDIRIHPLVLLQQALSETDTKQAITVAQNALDKISLNTSGWTETPMLQYLLARLCFQSGMNTNAQQAVEGALAIWPDEPQWQVLAARIYQAHDVSAGLPDIAKAILHLEQAVVLEPEIAANQVSLGKAYLSNGLAQQSVIALEQAVRMEPENADSWLSLAQAQVEIGEYKQAADSAERAVQKSSQSPAALLLRAEIALKAGNPRGALNRLQGILIAEPANGKALYLAAHSLEALNRPAEAIIALDKAIPLLGNSISIQMERIQLMRRTKGFEPAMTALEELITQNPNHPELVATLSGWLAEAGKHQAAIQAAQLALQQDTGEFTNQQRAELHTMIGLHMRHNGQLDQAIYHLSEAIEQSAGHLDAYLELGRAYQERKEYKQALKVFQKAIGISGTDYRPYYLAGMVLKDSKDYVAAEAMLRRAAQLAPNEVSVHRLLGAVVALNLVHNHRLGSVEAHSN